MSKIKFIISDIFLAIILIVIDQITKKWAVARLKDNTPIELIDNAFELYYLPNGNTGAAFGMLSGHRLLFILIAIIVVVLIAFALSIIPLERKYRLLRIMLIAIAAGGIGNMIDRIFLNYVIDFIYFSLINFPIFNVADCYVTIGTIFIAVLILFVYKNEDFDFIEDRLKKRTNKNN